MGHPNQGQRKMLLTKRHSSQSERDICRALTTLNLIIYSRKFVMTGTVWYERNSSGDSWAGGNQTTKRCIQFSASLLKPRSRWIQKGVNCVRGALGGLWALPVVGIDVWVKGVELLRCCCEL